MASFLGREKEKVQVNTENFVWQAWCAWQDDVHITLLGWVGVYTVAQMVHRFLNRRPLDLGLTVFSDFVPGLDPKKFDLFGFVNTML